MHRAYAPRLRSPGSPASRDRRRHARTKPSRIRHPQRSRTKAPIVCNPKCVSVCVCVCAEGERKASKRKENKWIGIFVKHLVNRTQRITITITITITIVRVLGRVVVVWWLWLVGFRVC